MKKELGVVAALIKKGASFLFCQRRDDDNYALLWEFPGGLIEEGESLPQAIEREIKEEVCLDIKADNFIKEFFDEDENIRIRVSLYACSIKGGTPQAHDCRDFSFFTLREAEKLSFAPVDRKIFNYLKADPLL